MLMELLFCLVFMFRILKKFIYEDDDVDGNDIPGVDNRHSTLTFAVAHRLEKIYDGKAYVGLRIPDPDTRSRLHIEIVLVTKREVMVVAVRNFSGFVDEGAEGSWICSKDKDHTETHPDPVMEVTKQVAVLEAYLEQRGVSLPKGHLIGKVVLPTQNCRTSYSIESQPEVIPFEKWLEIKPLEIKPSSEPKSGFSNWIKDAFRREKSEVQDGLNQRLNSILITAPMWDRLEFKGDRIFLGEFIEFKANQDDMQALRNLRRSRVSRIVVQKSTLFEASGRTRIGLLYCPRDYRSSEGTSSASELRELGVKRSTEVLFHPLNSKKPCKFKLSSIVSITLSG